MAENTGRIFQSGERVQITGTYAVAGTKPTAVTARKHEQTIRDLGIGESFPVYEGMDVVWWLVRTTEAEEMPISEQSLRKTAHMLDH